jgi:hypothetical protein
MKKVERQKKEKTELQSEGRGENPIADISVFVNTLPQTIPDVD